MNLRDEKFSATLESDTDETQKEDAALTEESQSPTGPDGKSRAF